MWHLRIWKPKGYRQTQHGRRAGRACCVVDLPRYLFPPVFLFGGPIVGNPEPPPNEIRLCPRTMRACAFPSG
jgi:hypothetical protein